MTEIAWATVRDTAIELYNGETPSPPTESEIISEFEKHPNRVLRLIEEVGADLHAAKIGKAWPILQYRAARAANAPRTATADAGSNRELKIRQAEAWVINAGLHCDRWDEDVYDELFRSPQGHLHPWRHDTMLADRIKTLWEQQRPAGEQLEREDQERAKHYVERKQQLRDHHKAKREKRDAAA